jgi:hypothetical protein
VTYQLRFRDEALAAYGALRADEANEAGKRMKAALERLIDDPGQAKIDSARWESLGGKVWSLTVEMPDESTRLILWAEQPEVIEVFYASRCAMILSSLDSIRSSWVSSGIRRSGAVQ